mmetsp:Transcript_12972/g.24128  ORF Transcript_12972/g.24128 Transcript_12972/m.24128 type:complete len:218 (-) Transcript_12972:10-663(-)
MLEISTVEASAADMQLSRAESMVFLKGTMSALASAVILVAEACRCLARSTASAAIDSAEKRPSRPEVKVSEMLAQMPPTANTAAFLLQVQRLSAISSWNSLFLSMPNGPSHTFNAMVPMPSSISSSLHTEGCVSLGSSGSQLTHFEVFTNASKLGSHWPSNTSSGKGTSFDTLPPGRRNDIIFFTAGSSMQKMKFIGFPASFAHSPMWLIMGFKYFS